MRTWHFFCLSLSASIGRAFIFQIQLLHSESLGCDEGLLQRAEQQVSRISLLAVFSPWEGSQQDFLLTRWGFVFFLMKNVLLFLPKAAFFSLLGKKYLYISNMESKKPQIWMSLRLSFVLSIDLFYPHSMWMVPSIHIFTLVGRKNFPIRYQCSWNICWWTRVNNIKGPGKMNTLMFHPGEQQNHIYFSQKGSWGNMTWSRSKQSMLALPWDNWVSLTSRYAAI